MIKLKRLLSAICCDKRVEKNSKSKNKKEEHQPSWMYRND